MTVGMPKSPPDRRRIVRRSWDWFISVNVRWRYGLVALGSLSARRRFARRGDTRTSRQPRPATVDSLRHVELTAALGLGAVAVIVVTAFASRIGVASPLILVLVGVLASLVPGVP